MKFLKQEFGKRRIDLDGNEFFGCKFNRTNFVYRGTGGVTLKDCKFFDCVFSFDGPAALTIQFMKLMYKEGFTKFIEKTISDIKSKSSDIPSGIFS